jgi:type IV pilus assembly protein PilM
MLFSRPSAGIEISHHGVTCALVSGSASSPRVDRVATASFAADTLQVSLRELNVLDPDRFVTTVRSAHNLLLAHSNKVAVTLPDSVGRIMLLDLEGRFKSRTEALDLIRWKLKKSIPFEMSDTHLDYQQLAVRENGDLALLVALVSRSVIAQYEELFTKAGLSPGRIDFNSFNLCRVFDRRISLGDDCLLLAFYATTLTIIAFAQGIPEFIRIKDLSGAPATDNRVYLEISSSLLVYRERFPDHQPHAVYCLSSPQMELNFQAMVAEATEASPVVLETKAMILPGNDAPGDQTTLFPYTAAIGAALRSL